MSVPSTIPELQEDHNKDLLESYRKGQLAGEDEVELFELIHTLKEKYKSKFKIRDELKKSFDYTDFDVGHFNGSFNKWLKRQGKSENPSPALEPKALSTPMIQEKAKQVSVGATKALFDQVQEIGSALVLQYAQKASLRGESLKDYVMKSVEYREAYSDSMDEMQEENDQLRALCSILVEQVKPAFKALAASRLYVDFQLRLLQLEAAGIQYDQAWANDVLVRMENAMGVPANIPLKNLSR